MQSGQSGNFWDENGIDTEHKPLMSELTEFEKSIWNSHGESSLNTMPWWAQVKPEEASSNQNQYLAESSAFVSTATPDTMLDNCPLPAFPNLCDASGLCDYQLDLPSSHYLGLDCGSTSNQLHAFKHHEDLGSQFSGRGLQAPDYVSWIERLNGESSGFSAPRVGTERASVGAPAGSSTKQRSRATSTESKLTDRQRKNQIADKLAALQELVPNSTQGCQASVLDDIIDLIKNLNLQIKDECESKVRSEHESTSVPIIFREGFGHYLCDEEVLGELLEEMIGKLLESNPEEAMRLLQMQGLLLMPIHYAQRLA